MSSHLRMSPNCHHQSQQTGRLQQRRRVQLREQQHDVHRGRDLHEPLGPLPCLPVLLPGRRPQHRARRARHLSSECLGVAFL